MKPRKTIVPLAVGLAWQCGALFQEKIDGRFATRQLAGSLLAGELVGDRFTAFDLIETQGQDVRHCPLLDRWRALNSLAGELTRQCVSIVRSASNGGELLASVLASGGEGVVRKEWHATYFDAMTACKRLETFACVVTGINAGQSVQIAFAPPDFNNLQSPPLILNGLEPAGNMPLRGGKADCVKIGSLLKVEAFGRHASGLLREARPCKDTPTSWLIKF